MEEKKLIAEFGLFVTPEQRMPELNETKQIQEDL